MFISFCTAEAGERSVLLLKLGGLFALAWLMGREEGGDRRVLGLVTRPIWCVSERLNSILKVVVRESCPIRTIPCSVGQSPHPIMTMAPTYCNVTGCIAAMTACPLSCC